MTPVPKPHYVYTDFRSVDSFVPTSGLMAAISRQAVHEQTTCRCQKQQRFFWIQSQGHSRLNRLRSPLFVFDKLNRSRLFFSGTFMGMLLLNAAPSRDVCITDLLFVTVRRSYCISHKYPLQRPISCVIVSITKLLIVIGSPRAYLSRNWRAITWVFNKSFAGSGHMVQNKLHWDANDAVGLPKQKKAELDW